MGRKQKMKNIVNEKPDDKLTGRLKFSSEFVNKENIKGKKVLDIGCGYGWFENYCIKLRAEEVEGVEISESDLKTARDYIKNKNVNFSVASALKLPFENNYFDTVVAWEVIEHIPKNTEKKMFNEVHRVLKENGIFYLSTPSSAVLSKYLDPAFWLIGHRHYNIQELVDFGMRNNFADEKLKVVGGIWTTLLIINMYISKWIFRRECFFNEYFDKNVDKEYRRDGFYNIFVKFRKQ